MVGGIGRRGDTWLDKIATRKVVGFFCTRACCARARCLLVSCASCVDNSVNKLWAALLREWLRRSKSQLMIARHQFLSFCHHLHGQLKSPPLQGPRTWTSQLGLGEQGHQSWNGPESLQKQSEFTLKRVRRWR